MNILITGFEAFADNPHNPSADLALRLSDLGYCEVLPVEFTAATERIRTLIAEKNPDIVLSLGLAAGAPSIRIERVAINLMDAPIPDNMGNRPIDELVNPTGPGGYLSTLPVKEMLATGRTTGAPMELSLSAGTYVCNAVMYAALDVTIDSDTRCGFIHVPLTDVVSADDQESAIRAAVRAAASDEK